MDIIHLDFHILAEIQTSTSTPFSNIPVMIPWNRGNNTISCKGIGIWFQLPTLLNSVFKDKIIKNNTTLNTGSNCQNRHVWSDFPLWQLAIISWSLGATFWLYFIYVSYLFICSLVIYITLTEQLFYILYLINKLRVKFFHSEPHSEKQV